MASTLVAVVSAANQVANMPPWRRMGLQVIYLIRLDYAVCPPCASFYFSWNVDSVAMFF